MSSVETRAEAISQLIDTYRERHGKSGSFCCHEGLEFQYSKSRGFHVKTSTNIKQDELLLRIPRCERVSYSTVAEAGILVPKAGGGTSIPLSKILDEIFERCFVYSMNNCRELTMNILVLYLVSNRTPFSPVVATWPSIAEMEELKLGYQPGLEGTYAEFANISNRSAERGTVEWEIFPTLRRLGVLERFQVQGNSLVKSYLYAMSLVRSRSHDASLSEEPQSLVIWPLVELVNGLPSCDHVNVRQTPLEKGDYSIVAKDGGIAAGDEILLNYGGRSASKFVMSYGICPDEFWQEEELAIDYLAIYLKPKYHIYETPSFSFGESTFSFMRGIQDHHDAIVDCNCVPFATEYFIFPPDALTSWKSNPSELPWCIRDLVLFLEIKFSTIAQLRNSEYRDKLMKDARDGKVSRKAFNAVLDILQDNPKNRLVAPTSQDIRRLKQGDAMSQQERTATILQMLAQESLLHRLKPGSRSCCRTFCLMLALTFAVGVIFLSVLHGIESP